MELTVAIRVLIVYNTPPSGIDFAECHKGVLDSVRHVSNAITELGYSYETMGIGADLRHEMKVLADTSADVLFNLCESICGQSRLQPLFAGYLDLIGIPFTGAPAEAITLAIDKQKTKALLSAAGIPTPEHYAPDQLLAADASWPPSGSFPLIVKPAQEDGSIGIEQDCIADNPSQLMSLLRKATNRFGRHILVERYIAGREISVGLLGNDQIQVMPLVEAKFRDLPMGRRPIITYQVKWEPASSEHLNFQRICPAQLPPETEAYIATICRDAYNLIGLCGYGRIDIRLEADSSLPYIIDVNANPDITGYEYGSSIDNSATLPLAARAAGISYTELIDKIINFALQRSTIPAHSIPSHTSPPAS